MSSCVLLTTCNLQTDGTRDLLRLVHSVDAASRSGEVGRVRHIVLLQCSDGAQQKELEKALPACVELIASPEALPPSTARNELIRHWRSSENFDPDDFVGFPDDDAWYPTGALACIARQFDSERLEFLLCRYGPDASSGDGARAARPSLQRALSQGSCAAIFVRARLLDKLGGFNELLGIRTRLSGGEDTEFSFRAFNMAAGQSLYLDAFLVGHLASNPAKRARYYEGGLAAIMAHSRSSTAGRVALVRKLLVGVWLVLNRRLSWHAFASAVERARKNVSAIREDSARQRDFAVARSQ